MCMVFVLYQRCAQTSQLVTYTPHTHHIIFCHEVNLGHLGLCLDRVRDGGCDLCTDSLGSIIKYRQTKN